MCVAGLLLSFFAVRPCCGAVCRDRTLPMDSTVRLDSMAVAATVAATDSLAAADSVTAAYMEAVFAGQRMADLPELKVVTRRSRLLHIIAYVRENSSLTTYTDTVFMYREKMVDFMIPLGGRIRFDGWRQPRVLASRSYYRFTNVAGLDSVSDECQHHFSWSDWVGVPPAAGVPQPLRGAGYQPSDSLRGKYSVAEVWRRKENAYGVDVNVLAREGCRRWVPELSTFFDRGVEFDQLSLHYDFDNVLGDTVAAADLCGYQYDVESRGRGHAMFRFNRKDEPFFVATHAEVYIMDREILRVPEARKWERLQVDADAAEMWYPPEAAPLAAEIVALKERVDNIDKEGVRLQIQPDAKMVSHSDGRKNFRLDRRIWNIVKGATGISRYRHNRNQKQNWREFHRDRQRRNALRRQ